MFKLNCHQCPVLLALAIYVMLGILMPSVASAQNPGETRGGIVSGVVTDDVGPVVGAAVMVRGSNGGVTTGLDGEYTLSGLKQNDVIVVSIIGYASQEITWTGQAKIDFMLEVSSEFLDEVVVTALGIKRSEKALSYNVQQVKSDAIMTVRDANFISSLNGKVAGVTINSSNSAGGASRVVMRGIKSITSDNLALYVIDGVPMYNMMNGGSEGSVYSNQPGTDGVADLNPDDIESITMLTGPSAAALYGNMAAAGVVMITTKKGVAGKTSVTYSNNTTFSSAYMMPKMQSKYGNLPNTLDSWGPIVNSGYDPSGFFRTGVNEMNTLSLSTGNNKNQTYISVATTNATNILPNSGYNRYNFTLRNTTKFLKDKMTLDFGASYILQDDKNMVSQGFYYNPLPGLYRFPRSENFDDVRMYERYNASYGVMEKYWPYGGKTEGLDNPYWIQNRQLRENKKGRYMINASLTYDILDWLNVSGRVKVDNYNNRYTYKAYASTGSLDGGDRGSYNDTNSTSKNTYADVIATIDKTWTDFSVNVNIGASINDSRYETIGYDGSSLKEFNFFAVRNINFNKAWKAIQSGWHDQTQAVFASAELGFRDMLYLTATGRNDWDSRLAFSDYSSFFYPSVGLSAIVSNMFHAPRWLSLLKVRASYTEVGNAYDRFLTTVTYPYDEQSDKWSTSAVYPNTKLKPERTKSWEVGVDANFFNDLSLSLTYYRSNTFNQTFFAKLSESSGYSSIPVQSGNILNEGIEMSLGYSHKWGEFSFGANYTLTWNRNEIVELCENAENYATGEKYTLPQLEVCSYGPLDSRLILRKGGTMGDVYGQRLLTRDSQGYIEVDPTTGLSMTNQEVFLGSILPVANMGLNFNFAWKGISLGLLFNARLGGVAMSATQSILDAAGVSEASALARDNGDFVFNGFKVASKDYYSTVSGTAAYYTYDATNVRLGEVSLSYSLPRKWFKDKMGMTLGLVGKNLCMIYCKAPFDPELTTAAGSNFYQGFDAYMLPSTRSLGFNVKLQF
ncbi:MAG: SusC/RagA family TonB-linked outer membrane protein [Bacteroidales bacterium]|nr:SusC/RagA family TonB-linked outer membrane protein [Bacteroidales bacterium]